MVKCLHGKKTENIPRDDPCNKNGQNLFVIPFFSGEPRKYTEDITRVIFTWATSGNLKIGCFTWVLKQISDTIWITWEVFKWITWVASNGVLNYLS